MVYIYKLESVRENETQKIPKDYEMPTSHLMPVWISDLLMIKVKKKKKKKKKKRRERERELVL